MHQAFSSQARPGSEVPPRAERAMSPIPGGRVKPVLSAANILVGETKASEPRSGQGGAGFEGRANLSKSLGRREEAGDWPSARPTHCPPPHNPRPSLLHGRHAAGGRVDLGHSVGTGPLLCPLNAQTLDSGLRCRPLLQTRRPNGGLCQGHGCPP